MKVMNFVNLINQAFRFVIQTSNEFNIDDGGGGGKHHGSADG
jgi:hypothetical protein